jgi:hypothetical protein
MTRDRSIRHRRIHRRRGVATITALTLLALVGVALATMGTLLAYDARRTRDATDGAQLRQLLIAGAVAAVADPAPRDVPLPPALGPDAKLTIGRVADADADGSFRVEVTAVLGGRTASQALQVAPSGTITAAELRF